jgi:L-ascorbate metabolism protein UlaG (beta-lactamase superfamily)
VQTDVAFLPVGGTYTMDYQEAAEAVQIIDPTYAIPMHYGSIVGSENDAKKFVELVGSRGVIIPPTN